MRIESSRRLRGPNRYVARPVQVTRVLLDGLTGRESSDHPGFTDRLLAAFPGSPSTTAPRGARRLRQAAHRRHLLRAHRRHVAHRALPAHRPPGQLRPHRGHRGARRIRRRHRVPGRRATRLPRCRGAPVAGDHWSVPAALHDEPVRARTSWRLRRTTSGRRAGPSTAAIADAARARGIPFERVGELGACCASATAGTAGWCGPRSPTRPPPSPSTSPPTRRSPGSCSTRPASPSPAACAATSRPGPGPLRRARPARRRQAAGRAARAMHVLARPRHARRRLRAAYEAATAAGTTSWSNANCAGRDYRVLIVAVQVAAAAERVAGHVVGDGEHDVAELIARTNEDPRRGVGPRPGADPARRRRRRAHACCAARA